MRLNRKQHRFFWSFSRPNLAFSGRFRTHAQLSRENRKITVPGSPLIETILRKMSAPFITRNNNIKLHLKISEFYRLHFEIFALQNVGQFGHPVRLPGYYRGLMTYSL
jgi:hypothetical protein